MGLGKDDTSDSKRAKRRERRRLASELGSAESAHCLIFGMASCTELVPLLGNYIQ